MSNKPINIIRATYKTAGPTSVSDSSLSRTKKIQVRVAPRYGSDLRAMWGLKSRFNYANRGDSSQVVRFAGVFPRMRY
jgi:hypothetical protein